jgi:hypothetical protein
MNVLTQIRQTFAVTLIIPARKGLFLNDIIEIADILLTDSDDLVQKGYLRRRRIYTIFAKCRAVLLRSNFNF